MEDHPLLISHEEFDIGYVLYAFGLFADQSCMDHYSRIKTLKLWSDICFAQPLPITIKMILYGVFDNAIKINHW